MDLKKEVTEPFPFVPATWITGDNLRWGLPNLLSNRKRRLRDKSIFFGCKSSSLFKIFVDLSTFESSYKEIK